MLNQAQGDRQILAKELGISPHQLSYVTHSGPGEGLLFFGNVIIPFVDRFPKDTTLYKIMTTRLSDMSDNFVFMLQEIHLFFGRMILLPVVINTGFATGKATSTGQVCIDFIIRNELADKGHLHHIGLILTQRQIQLIQLFLNEIQLVIVKTKQSRIFRKGFSKFRILLYQGCVETRVIKLFSQVCGFIRKPTKRLA